ncbi:MAG: hypothetical protein AAFY60_17935, partial [Myxococcota bacterium]
MILINVDHLTTATKRVVDDTQLSDSTKFLAVATARAIASNAPSRAFDELVSVDHADHFGATWLLRLLGLRLLSSIRIRSGVCFARIWRFDTRLSGRFGNWSGVCLRSDLGGLRRSLRLSLLLGGLSGLGFGFRSFRCFGRGLGLWSGLRVHLSRRSFHR